MLPNDIRRRVDAIWDRVWASGVSNPLTAIEYLSTVLLLRRLTDQGGSNAELWAEAVRYAKAGDANAVAILMLRVQSEFGIGASPDVACASTWRDTSVLNSVLLDVANLDLTDRNHDILGDVFEYMLNHLNTAGQFGQFRTPRHLIRFMVETLDPRQGEVVVDPACGTAGFLVAAHEHRGGRHERYSGEEMDATIVRIASTNSLLHGMSGATIRHSDGLANREADADVILANPPFAGSVIAERVRDFESGTLKTELLFMELMLGRLRPGGRAAVIVPTGVITSPSASALWVRRQLLECNRLKAVVELPSGVFRPYTDVRTAILFWSNDSPTEDVLFVRVARDGYSLDDKRTPVSGNDLPAVHALITGKKTDIRHARVPVTDIVAQRYNLSPSRYVSHQTVLPIVSEVPLADALRDARQKLGMAEMMLSRMEAMI